jgi:hypothetical protein
MMKGPQHVAAGSEQTSVGVREPNSD